VGKHHAFDEILNSQFRWPKADDKPFVAADDPWENASIENHAFSRMIFMMEGYKKAADLMVGAANADEVERGYLVFPIIFNYRQFIELSLKYLIATYGKAVEIEPNWNSHNLEVLWKTFKEMLDRYGNPDPDEADSVVERIVAEFAKVDPASYSFRYPVDRNGGPIPVAYADLHLPTLQDVMQAVGGYFTGCEGYLDNLRQ
jgi:hypothetical protein